MYGWLAVLAVLFAGGMAQAECRPGMPCFKTPPAKGGTGTLSGSGGCRPGMPCFQTPGTHSVPDPDKVSKPRGVAPVRWVCVSRLKEGVNGKAVTAETKGEIGTDCSKVQQLSLVDLGNAKALTKAGSNSISVASAPVEAADAEVFCRKEEFATACE